jgi:hypothetical protein
MIMFFAPLVRIAFDTPITLKGAGQIYWTMVSDAFVP